MQVTPYTVVSAILTGSVCPKYTTVPKRERDSCYLEVPCTKTFWRIIAWVVGTCYSPFIASFLFCHYCFSTPWQGGRGEREKKKKAAKVGKAQQSYSVD